MYLCKVCSKYTTVDYGSNKITNKEILVRHLEGTPIRKLAKQTDQSRSVTARVISATLKHVPNSNHVTALVCKYFSRGILIVDGKYLHVKGFEKKIPLIWAIDEYSHDPLIHLLAPSENFEAYSALFTRLRKCGYPLQVLICDEHPAIIQAVKSVYPKVKIQLCLNHYRENIRRLLTVRTTYVHKYFMRDIEGLFKSRTKARFSYRAKRMIIHYGKNEKYRLIMIDINVKFDYLTTHYDYKCPTTTNLIEAFNSHLEARIKSLRGFESFLSAELWLNAYVMNRRLSKFTDCTKRYGYLNGVAPIQITAKEDDPKISLLTKVS